MSNAERHVVVVGGGPAGLATAIALAQRDVEVSVVDAQRPPIDKACGEGLMPPSRKALERLGVHIEGLPGRDFRGIRYSDARHSVIAEFPGSPGRGVRRLVLHGALVERARELGVELHWGRRVTDISSHDSEGWRIETDSGSFRSCWLVGADGLRSKVRRWVGLEGRPVGFERFGVRRHYRIPPWSDLVEVHWTRNCEAYVTPVDDELVGVAMLWNGGGSGFDSLLEGFPVLARRLGSAEVATRDRGIGPLRQRARGVTASRAALVGDAAGYVDAITGEGLALAFQQAHALADAVVEDRPADYSEAASRIVRDPDRLTLLTLQLARRPWLRRRVLAAMQRRPELLARLLAVQNGEGSLLRDGSGALTRLALASLLPGRR